MQSIPVREAASDSSAGPDGDAAVRLAQKTGERMILMLHQREITSSATSAITHLRYPLSDKRRGARPLQQHHLSEMIREEGAH
jgi:hypothetical protein